MKKITKAKLGGAVLAASMLHTLFLGCNDPINETPAPTQKPEPLPKLVVENFDVELNMVPLNGDASSGRYKYPAEWEATATWTNPTDANYAGLTIESSEVSGTAAKNEVSKKLDGTITTPGNHEFRAKPSGAEGQDADTASTNKTAEDKRSDKQKLDAWLDDDARVWKDFDLYLKDYPDYRDSLKENWSPNYIKSVGGIDGALEEFRTQDGLTKATPKNKSIANQNRMAKAIVKNSRVRGA